MTDGVAEGRFVSSATPAVVDFWKCQMLQVMKGTRCGAAGSVEMRSPPWRQGWS